MLKITVSALTAGAILLSGTAVFAGSLAPVMVEPVPMAPMMAPVGSLGGYAPLLGVAAAVAVVALIASDGSSDDEESTDSSILAAE